MVTKHPMLQHFELESICQAMTNTKDGLTGSEISKLLMDSKVNDISPSESKARRLYNALAKHQNDHQCSNGLLTFIQNAMQPVKYIGKESVFQDRRNEVNKRLSFLGFEVAESGKFRKVTKSQTIPEAEQRANKFKYKLENRNTHAYIFKYTVAELLVENYFHSVFEATKSVADRIREMTGLTTDGAELIDVAFSASNPLIKINNLATSTDRSEHFGFKDIIKGVFSLIRNPTAHLPKIKFEIAEDEALDMMSMISYIHKRLDKVIK